MNNGLWTVDTVDTISSHVIFKILKLSIIHYLVLSLTTCHIPPIHTEKVDFLPMFRWLLTGKVDAGRCFERLSFNVERIGMENKYSGMLAWEEGILYLWDKLEYTFTRWEKIFKRAWYFFTRLFVYLRWTRIYFHSLGENIQASLIFFHSFIRIFDEVWLRIFEYQTIKKNLHENGQWIRNC